MNYDLTFLTAILAAIIGILLSLLSALWAPLFKKRRAGETTEQRINRLTKSLSEAIQLIDQIEKEIVSRHVLASKLQDDIETYNKIMSLKKSEVEAVAQLLRGELRKEGSRSFWQNVGINFVFFVLGVIVTLVMIRIF